MQTVFLRNETMIEQLTECETDILLSLSQLSHPEILFIHWLLLKSNGSNNNDLIWINHYELVARTGVNSTHELITMLRKLNTEILYVQLPRIRPRSLKFFCLGHLQLTSDQYMYASLGAVLSHHHGIIFRMMENGIISQLATFSSTTVKLIFLLLKQYGCLKIPTSQFLCLIGIEHLNAYRRNDNLKQNILNPAITELKRNYFPNFSYQISRQDSTHYIELKV